MQHVTHWPAQPAALVSSRRSLAEAAAAAAAVKARLGPASRFKAVKAGKKARVGASGAAVTVTPIDRGRDDGRHRGAKKSTSDQVRET